ncbi:PAS domain-containing protein [Sulfitobacter sp. F26169L]|uniref:PAS domain-containing protein n=1 Tax=Sulfitobacter sp. F26169L TaxID=2996015 RepID=UPI002260A9C4|nr:PAS domain-containing protein [Sulfitobacter sp. F26169L]MCX7565495.1 PAS domain-containing protein [Sulfitobacter sp. F26169L]
MSDYKPHTGYVPLSLVEAYWDALRAGREMPKRAEIDPRGIESALEFAFILERVAPGVARMRIAGSHLNDIMGMEARGMPLTAFFEQHGRTRIASLLEEVFQTPATAEVRMQATGGLELSKLEARMVLLPLKSDLGDVSRILGCLVSQGDLGDASRRFEIRDVKLRPLGMEPIPHPALNQQPRTEGFADPQAAFTRPEPQTTASRKRRPPYLRLIKTDT